MSKSLQEAVVERAVQLLENGWCRGALARDREGNRVDVYSAAAVEFCIIGSLLRATRDVLGPAETPAAAQILCAVIDNFRRLMAANDVGTTADAAAALRKFGEELSRTA